MTIVNPRARSVISVFDPECPSRYTLELFTDKWAMLIIVALKRGARRNGELKRAIGNISQKMLTQTLRTLENNGIVERTVFNTVPPHVEYTLTELGISLNEPIFALADWAEKHWAEVLAARSRSQTGEDAARGE
ncbi:MAG: helix-turn-helix domain-containing protein [Chloroflexota bacterium]|nr:helix-turn-helix domain-containing protein [Chloroflexota bacterium]